jgi:signal transduction histidine kinase
MLKGMCIRNKVLLFFMMLIAVDLLAVYLLEKKTERELQAVQESFRDLFSYSRGPDYILTGNMSGTLILREYASGELIREFPGALSLLRNYRNQLLMLFGVSLAAGVFIAVYAMRCITRPLFKLTRDMNTDNGSAQAEGGSFRQCTVLARLNEAFRKYQQELMESEEQKSRQESVELTKTLAAGVAHEIKNPINTVGLIVDHLQRNLSPDDPEKRYEFYKLTENLQKELKRVNRIVEGFLRLTKPHVYSFHDENVNDILRDVVINFETELARQGVRTVFNLADDLGAVQADRDKLSQVFTNLIINAMEAMPRGGTLTLTTEPGTEHVRVLVEDSGVGIPEESLKKVYSPYYTTKKQGFGLGLSLIQDIVDRHRGKITLNSRKGEGTRFTITLPRKLQDDHEGEHGES